MESQANKQNSNVFGIIALVIAIISLFTPRIFLTLVLLALAIFTILGFVKDNSKIFSFLALGIGGFIFFSLFSDALKSEQSYSITYKVTCKECEVRYTNETGGNDKVELVYGGWSKDITAKGDDFLHLSAQNHDCADPIHASISINGKMVKAETSTGKYSIASTSCRPKDEE